MCVYERFQRLADLPCLSSGQQPNCKSRHGLPCHPRQLTALRRHWRSWWSVDPFVLFFHDKEISLIQSYPVLSALFCSHCSWTYLHLLQWRQWWKARCRWAENFDFLRCSSLLLFLVFLVFHCVCVCVCLHLRLQLKGSPSPFNGCCACGLKITHAQRKKKWHPLPHCHSHLHSHSHSALLSCVSFTPSHTLFSIAIHNNRTEARSLSLYSVVSCSPLFLLLLCTLLCFVRWTHTHTHIFPLPPHKHTQTFTLDQK